MLIPPAPAVAPRYPAAAITLRAASWKEPGTRRENSARAHTAAATQSNAKHAVCVVVPARAEDGVRKVRSTPSG
jgi:hypothetical protein